MLDVVGDLDCVPWSHAVRTYVESRGIKTGTRWTHAKIFIKFSYFLKSCVHNSAKKDTGNSCQEIAH